jgi:hypothetical protein
VLRGWEVYGMPYDMLFVARVSPVYCLCIACVSGEENVG